MQVVHQADGHRPRGELEPGSSRCSRVTLEVEDRVLLEHRDPGTVAVLVGARGFADAQVVRRARAPIATSQRRACRADAGRDRHSAMPSGSLAEGSRSISPGLRDARHYDPPVVPEATEVAITSSPPRQSRIFELPIELGHPDELLRADRRLGRRGRADQARDVRQRARAQPVARGPGAARGARGRRPRLLRRLRRAPRRQGAERRDPAPHDRRRLDLGSRRALRAAGPLACTCSAATPASPRQAGQRLRRAHPRLRVVGTHHGYFQIGSGHDERVIEDINARATRHPARRDGNAEAGDLGAAHGRPPELRRAVERRGAV